MKTKYTIEYRYLKDPSFFKGWFRELKPEWSNWEQWVHPNKNYIYITEDYNTIIKLIDKLTTIKRTKVKYEYRIRELND